MKQGFGYVWLTQGVGDEQHFIRIFRQRLTEINFQDWAAGLNASSRFDHYREFKTALNVETYLDCIKQKCFRDWLIRIRLRISNLKVHKNRYARCDVPQDNDCPLCPGMQDDGLSIVPGYAGKRLSIVPGYAGQGLSIVPGYAGRRLSIVPWYAEQGLSIVPGYAGRGTTLVLCVQKIREDKTEHAEKY